ncbi:MAG: HAD-IC family P-type ATPase, partial [SAR202 cluster bacterium]|nr:HAD-IC family P-type ATPase [SAR202 cluster bacterium]
VSGRGTGVVVATGRGTQIGVIARDVRQAARVETPLQQRMRRFGLWITAAIVVSSLAAFGIGIAQGRDISEMFLVAVAVAVAAIPEGLPVVMTIALAVGVRRMARRNAIIRRLAAVETLGSCTVIMSDKTGTLTENRMTVQSIYAGGTTYTITGSGLSLIGAVTLNGSPVNVERDLPLLAVLQAGVLTNEASVRPEDHTYTSVGDPTEVALLVAAAKAGLSATQIRSRMPEVGKVPFEPDLQFSATVQQDGDTLKVFLKGAPERVLRMCDSKLTADGPVPLDEARIRNIAHQMAGQGLRVLAMAVGEGKHRAEAVLKGIPQGLTFVGLQGMMDPPRPEAVEAVRDARRAGIRVLMVTGDHPGTASAIARLIGIDDEDAQVYTGERLEKLSDNELAGILSRASIYARISPSQKLRIVNALRAQGHIVAVTGDGVNDAPALKSAHIGASMGLSGTEVAKEASDLVLVDDNFASIHAAVEEGRTSFANIRNATFFLISSGVAVLVAIIVNMALRAPLPFLPAQILWLNLVTNGIQDVALAFEPGEKQQRT